MIEADPSRIRWRPVLIAGVCAAVVPLLLVTLAVVLLGALVSAVQARGAPEPARVELFARVMGAVWGPPAVVAATAGAGAWVARRVRSRVQLHGVLVGGVAAVLGLVIVAAETRWFGAGALLVLAGTVAAGWFGAWATMAGRRRP
jgi:hypothetical protein